MSKLLENTADLQEILNTLKDKAVGGSSADGIPEGYARCDYIQFNGDQLIDLEVFGDQDTRITCSFTWGNATQNHVFGCASSGNTASITSFMNGSWRFGAKSATKTIQKNNTLLPYSVYVDKTLIGVTSSSTTISDVEDFVTPGTLLLGGARSTNGALPSSGLVGRVFYFNLWSGGIQILKLVPVVSDEGVYRFFDLISKEFFDSITDTQLDGGNL